MGSITINGKNVKKWVIGGKTIQSLTMGGKVLSFIQPNSFTGHFATATQENAFMAMVHTAKPYATTGNPDLTGFTMPEVIEVEHSAFYGTSATTIKIPKATTIADGAFTLNDINIIVNIWMNKKFDTNSEKDRIFGAGNWSNIVFHWTNNDGTPWVEPNAYHGTFSAPWVESAFMAIGEVMPQDNQFMTETGITGIKLPITTTIPTAAFGGVHLTSINIPKATTIGQLAFGSVVNAATTEVWINKKFDTNSEKDRIFGAGHWNNITFHWTNDDGSVYVPPTNSFTGTWNSKQIENNFMAIREVMPMTQEFMQHPGITGISLPITTTIPDAAFAGLQLTSIKIPKAVTIGQLAFALTVNASTTEVWINKKFNIYSEKDRIFNTGNWSNITFHWLNDDGTDYILPANSFTGTFTFFIKQDEFMSITNTVVENQFVNESNITAITLPEVKTIGNNAFYVSPLTYIKIPKADTIGDNSFNLVVNAPTTEVWMNKKFDTTAEKNRIFGVSNWGLINFHWLNDDGTPT